MVTKNKWFFCKVLNKTENSFIIGIAAIKCQIHWKHHFLCSIFDFHSTLFLFLQRLNNIKRYSKIARVREHLILRSAAQNCFITNCLMCLLTFSSFLQERRKERILIGIHRQLRVGWRRFRLVATSVVIVKVARTLFWTFFPSKFLHSSTSQS